ncbi:MAG: hypothetical protein ACTSWY_02060 [Promethearchaeota archaeon]
MVRFQKIWCINNQGIPLFYFMVDDSLATTTKKVNSIEIEDDQLISGLFSAIQTMTQVAMEEQIISIEMNNSKLLFNKHNNITFIGSIILETERDTSIAIKILKKITDQFIFDYQGIIDDWFGNTAIFEPFIDKMGDFFFYLQRLPL